MLVGKLVVKELGRLLVIGLTKLWSHLAPCSVCQPSCPECDAGISHLLVVWFLGFCDVYKLD